MKYIRFEDENLENNVIILFPKSINHDCMSEVCGGIKDQTHGSWKRVRRYPVSAGFVDSDMKCYGKSITLNLSSLKEDTEILRKQLK